PSATHTGVRRLAAFLLCCLCAAGCGKNDATPESVDRQTCLQSRLAPLKALDACTRFIEVVNGVMLTPADAYYNRGVAFMELGETSHARLDFEEALKLEPEQRWARQELDALNQLQSKSNE